MQNFLLGWSISSTIIALFTIWLLFKKVSTHNQIDNLKQKNKRNKNTNIDNEISARIEPEKKERFLKRLKNKRLTKRK